MPNDGIPTDEELIRFIEGGGHRSGAARNPVAQDAPAIPRKVVSVLLFDGEGRMLLQRRAASKYYSPGAWSSSCDALLWPGEAPEMAARWRLAEELKVIPQDLIEAGASLYWQTDPVLGVAEFVVNHVFVGRLLAPPRPNAAEVAGVAMASPAELRRMLAGEQFSSWFQAVADVALVRVPAWLAALSDWRPAAARSGPAD
jgi:isopentenyl-diphosphate Delta-isomerase